MANLAGQKTFLSMQTEIAEMLFSGNAASTTTIPSANRIKQMINDSVREICTEQDWWFMWKEWTFNTVANTQSYAMDDEISEVSSMKIEGSFIPLSYWPRERWYKSYPGGYTGYGPALPWAYIPAPPAVNGALQFNIFPAPNGVYTVTVLGKKRITDMSGDTDVPAPIPPEWQDLIIYRTLWKAQAMLGDPRANNHLAQYEERMAKMWLHNEHCLDYVNTPRSFYNEQGAAWVPNIDRAIWLG